MISLRVIEGNVMHHLCDLMILKHADGFYGVDEKVAARLNFSASIPEGSHAFFRGSGIEAHRVLFLGVGPLQDFRYEKIREFARSSLKIAATSTGVTRSVCLPIHGPGYGLDDHEAFLALVSGFGDAQSNGEYPRDLERIDIVEINATRARRLKAALDRFESISPMNDRGQKLRDFGAPSERKKKLFVAMPFAEKFSDVWDIAIKDACLSSNIVVERIDAASFTGDILTEIKNRLYNCVGLIALLDAANPNVFLEIGYAWALKKPTILIAGSDQELPFDVKGQRCLIYKSINNLRSLLTDEIKALQASGNL